MNDNKNIRKAYFASGCFWGTETDDYERQSKRR